MYRKYAAVGAGTDRWCCCWRRPCPAPCWARSAPAVDRPDAPDHSSRLAGRADRHRLLPGQQPVALRPGVLHAVPAPRRRLLRRPDPRRSRPGNAHRRGDQRAVPGLHLGRRQPARRCRVRGLGRNDRRPGQRLRPGKGHHHRVRPGAPRDDHLLRPNGHRLGLRPLGRRPGREGRHRRRRPDELAARPGPALRHQLRAGLRVRPQRARLQFRTRSIVCLSGRSTDSSSPAGSCRPSASP